MTTFDADVKLIKFGYIFNVIVMYRCLYIAEILN
jgi:hypothetical protein